MDVWMYVSTYVRTYVRTYVCMYVRGSFQNFGAIGCEQYMLTITL